jgi:uncharacterized membrane protein
MLEKIQKYLDRIESRWALWMLIGGPAMIGAGTAYFASFSQWVNSFGSFAWVFVFLITAMLAASLIFVIVFTRYWLQRSRAVNKWKSSLDDINPMETSFHSKRISIEAICDPITRSLTNKTFSECDLNGPANIYISGTNTITGVNFINCDLVIVKENSYIYNAIAIKNVRVVGGRIANTTFFVLSDNVGGFISAGMKPISYDAN